MELCTSNFDRQSYQQLFVNFGVLCKFTNLIVAFYSKCNLVILLVSQFWSKSTESSTKLVPVFPTVAMPWQMWPYLISSGHEFFSFMASHISPQKVQNVAIFDFAKFFGHIWAFSYKFWPFLANSYCFWKISFDFHLISKIRKILYWNFQKYNDLKMQ